MVMATIMMVDIVLWGKALATRYDTPTTARESSRALSVSIFLLLASNWR